MKTREQSTSSTATHLYDEDFFVWTQHNPELLRSGQFDHADIEHIAEEIEDMGKRDKREVFSSAVNAPHQVADSARAREHLNMAQHDTSATRGFEARP